MSILNIRIHEYNFSSFESNPNYVSILNFRTQIGLTIKSNLYPIHESIPNICIYIYNFSSFEFNPNICIRP